MRIALFFSNVILAQAGIQYFVGWVEGSVTHRRCRDLLLMGSTHPTILALRVGYDLDSGLRQNDGY